MQTLTELKMVELTQNLKAFGLNPADWELKPNSVGFLIENTEDKDFCFQGWATSGRWDRIQMLLEEELAVHRK